MATYFPAGGSNYSLGSSIGSTDTSILLSSFLEPVSGTAWTMSTFNSSIMYGTIAPKTSSSEFISFTGVTQNANGTATLTGVTRGLSKTYPYTGSSTYRLPHSGGSVFILSDAPQVFAEYVTLDNPETIEGVKTFNAFPVSGAGLPVSGTQFATKQYVDNTATGTTNVNRIIVAGTAGETIAVDQLVYLKASDGRWWLADADAAASSENVILGIAQGAGTAGNLITNGVLTQGLNTFSSLTLTANTQYYVSNTAGGFSSTPGTKEVSVGESQTTTTFLFYPRNDQQLTEDQQDALAGTSTSTPNASNKYVDNADTSNGNNVDQSQTTQDATVAVGEADATTKYYKIAQSFVAGKSPIVSVDLYKSANTGTYTGDVTVAIYADSGGSPTGSALATVTTANATYNALSTGANTFTFSSSYVPTLGTTYWIVISSSTGDNSNHPNLGTNSAGGYGSGSVKFNNTTDGWGAIATIDLYFKVNTNSTNKIVRFNSSTYPAGDGSNLTNITSTPVLTGIASGENITAGQPVYIDPSTSTVYKAHGFKQIDSVSVYSFPTTFVGRIAKLSSTQFLALYHNGTTTLSVGVYTTSTGASVDTETVTTSFDQTTASTTTRPSATVCRLSDTTFVIIYAKTTDNFLYFRTGSISGSTITLDTETAYSGTPDFCYGLESYPGASDGKVVFSYFNGTDEPGAGGSFTPILSYLTVATNSITVTTTVSGSTVTSGGYNADPAWSAVTFTRGIAYGLFCCANSGNQRRIKYNWINTNDSSTSADNETLNLESQIGAGVQTVYSQYLPSFIGHNGKAYFGWATNNVTNLVNTKTVLEINQVGCKCVYQYSTVRLAGDDAEYALPMIGNECGVVVFKFPTTETGSTLLETIYIQKDKIYSFPPIDSTTFYPTPGIHFSNQKDEVVFGNDGSFLRTWRLPTPMDGMAVASVTSPATPIIYTAQMTTSGLTANALYFLKDTYTTTGDMAFSGTIPVGQALSTTVMKIKPTE